MVAELAQDVSAVVVGLYVGGSLATGDDRPGGSDVDGVAMLVAAPKPEAPLVSRSQRCLV